MLYINGHKYELKILLLSEVDEGCDTTYLIGIGVRLNMANSGSRLALIVYRNKIMCLESTNNSTKRFASDEFNIFESR